MTERIGLLGAESSGKTTFAHALADALNNAGTPAHVVPEYLRTWCAQSGRLPTHRDQAAILLGQLAAEDAAARDYPGHVLICDPAAITTPLYSRLYFGDTSELDTELLARYSAVMWCDIDIPWIADPLRESPQMRARMHELISQYRPVFESAMGHDIPLVSGSVDARLRQAWQPDLPINSP